MNQACITTNGNTISNVSPLPGYFDHVDSTATSRYRESIESDTFSLIVMFDKDMNPIGYCSYLTYFLQCPFDSHELINVQINYVFLNKASRGLKLGNVLAAYVVDCLYELAKPHAAIQSFLDISEYVSNEGRLFGNKLRSGLVQHDLICEN